MYNPLTLYIFIYMYYCNRYTEHNVEVAHIVFIEIPFYHYLAYHLDNIYIYIY